MKKINDVNEFNEVLATQELVVVDFFADWCGPCQMLSPVMEKVSQDYPNITFIKVNVDVVSEIAEKYGVYSIPTLVFIKKRAEVNRQVGFIPEPQIKKLLSNF